MEVKISVTDMDVFSDLLKLHIETIKLLNDEQALEQEKKLFALVGEEFYLEDLKELRGEA